MKKLRSTTPVSKLIVFAVFVAALFGVGVMFNSTVRADEYTQKIDQIQKQIDSYNSEASKLGHESTSLKATINGLQAQQNAIQAKVDLSQVKQEQLAAQIKTTEQKIDKNQEVLGETIGNLYVNSRVSPVEMLASSKNIGDYVDQQEFRASVRDEVEVSIKQIKSLKKSLQKKKESVEKALAEQESQRNHLVSKKQEQANLLKKTQGQQAAYTGLVSELKEQRQEAEAALARSLSSGSYQVSPVGSVKAGDIVGAVGNSGLSTGAHLHLEVRSGGSVVNPNSYISGWQAPGGLTQGFGEGASFYGPGGHPGLDFGAAPGTPIEAIADGYLYRGCSIDMFNTTAYGYVAVVEHSNGTQSIYGHMSGGPAKCSANTLYG